MTTLSDASSAKSYLKFDRTLMTNLEQSLQKEFLRTNLYGSYMSSSVVGCNTRKYHGLLVVPIPQIDNHNHVILSSIDETVIQHGAEFNLGIHQYSNNFFSPKGHKYIREFHSDGIVTTIYRVGGIILKKEMLICKNDNRIVVRYTMIESYSTTTIRLKPFLAFRGVNFLTQENNNLDSNYQMIDNGISMCLYNKYPRLYMQTNLKSSFVESKMWYKNIEYFKELERGLDYKEDLFTPGYFEFNMQKGTSIVFSAGLSEYSSKTIRKTFVEEAKQIEVGYDFYTCLQNAAKQFFVQSPEDEHYILAGYPWFRYRMRDALLSLVGTTLCVGQKDMFLQLFETITKAIYDYINKLDYSTDYVEVHLPDVLLWYIWNIQQYAIFTSMQEACNKFGQNVMDIITYIKNQQHPNLFLHDNGLLFSNGKVLPATWMNATENNIPIAPRTGYIVEFNALWYNALCFGSKIAELRGEQKSADMLSYQASETKTSFLKKFWNGTYLYDFIDGNYNDLEVRPNMIFAVSMPHSPLSKEQQKSVVDITTKELLTIKGLRSLSPKSGMYRPKYVGGMLERNRNYFNGPIWAWTIGAYAEAYNKVYGQNSFTFIKRFLSGIEGELTELTVGTLSELYDGNPPYRGHGAMAYAPTVAGILHTLHGLRQHEKTATTQ